MASEITTFPIPTINFDPAGSGDKPTVSQIAGIKTTLALENVNNTSDANKEVSGPQQAALNLKANTSEVAANDSEIAILFATKLEESDIDTLTKIEAIIGETLVTTDDPRLDAAIDAASYDEDYDANYWYYGSELADASGYIAFKVSLTTYLREGTATGSLPMPADLTALTYT